MTSSAAPRAARSHSPTRARSIGFPALATGVGGFPIEACADVMISAAREYAQAHPDTKVELVVFVLRGGEDRDVFSQALAR